jgi:hypothetical protein
MHESYKPFPVKGENGTKTNLNIQVVVSVTHADLDRYQFDVIFRSSISNKRVLSISPWFLSTKSKARWPFETHCHCTFVRIHISLIQVREKKTLILPKNVVGLGPLLLKSFSGYPSSGGTMILQHCETVCEICFQFSSLNLLGAHYACIQRIHYCNPTDQGQEKVFINIIQKFRISI